MRAGVRKRGGGVCVRAWRVWRGWQCVEGVAVCGGEWNGMYVS